MEIILELQSMVKDLGIRKEILTQQLKCAQPERLLKTRNHGKDIILAVKGHGESLCRTTITKDRQRQIDIAKQSILFRELQEVNRQVKILDRAITELSMNCFEPQRFAIENYGWFNNEEIKECLDRKRHSDWMDEPYDKSDFRPFELTQMTSRGLLVRSKSELLIAEMLYKYGIEFRYEQVYHLPGLPPMAADFTIRRADGKLFIWEHEGLVNSRSYLARQQRKAECYSKLGYVPWDNLIITYDTSDGEIDLRIVESIIRTRLII